tara:strand:- start:75 stop:509 length:435 start_codon:yes stop_codon:yes gene_type:complete
MTNITADEALEIERLNDEFKYVRDSDQYGKRDAWYIMKEAPWDGDCEDYALTALYRLSGYSYTKMWISLLTRKAKLCFCTVRGTGHAVLKYKGEYVDNIQKGFCSKEIMEQDGYEFSKWLFIPYQVAIKLAIGVYIKRKNSSSQ